MGQNVYGYLKESSDRATWWKQISGELKVPLLNQPPIEMMSPTGESRTYYMIDVDRLTHQEIVAVCRAMAAESGRTFQEVLDLIHGGYGLPIRNSILSVIFSEPEES